jgi:hypothetical protein
MARSKEEKRAFIDHLRASAKALGETNPVIPSNIGASFSPSNALMILFQRPSATQCAGFHAWREAGRAVRKGSKGIAILVPLGTRVDEAGEETPVFSWRYVFDIADTDPLSDSSPRLARELVGA